MSTTQQPTSHPPARPARRWAPWAVGTVGALLVVAGAVVVAIQVAHQESAPPRFADYLPYGGPLQLSRHLIAGALAITIGAMVLAATAAWCLPRRQLPPRVRWVPWLSAVAVLAAGVVVLTTTPRPGDFGWFAYTPPSSQTASSAFGSSWTMSWSYPAQPVDSHLVTGAVLVLVGLVVGSAAAARRLRRRVPHS